MKIPFKNLIPENNMIRPSALRRISKLLNSSIFIEGSELNNFEKNFARYCGVPYCLGVGSGTDALRTALLACGIGPGDEVITTPVTYVATPLAIAHTGARPVFVDVKNDGNIDPTKIEVAITKKTKAVLIVHMYGNPCDIDPIYKITKKHDLFLIDDCSHAQGASYHGKKIGSQADISCFSFYPTKNLGAWGDAGGITTHSKHLRDQAYLFKNYGEKADERNFASVVGYNSKLDPIQAIILDEKLKHLDYWNKKRQNIAIRYQIGLKNISGITIPPLSKDCVYYAFPILVANRKKFQMSLTKKGIGTSIVYPQPMHLQKCFRYLNYSKGDFPIAEQFMNHVVALPFYPSMTNSEQDFVISSITSIS